MDALTGLLAASKLFSGVPEAVLAEEIIPRGSLQEFARDQFLIAPQQRVDRLGFILSGKVQILHIFADGSHSLMGVLSPGEFVGMDLVCTHSRIAPYHARAAAAAHVFFMPADLLVRAGALREDVRVHCLERMLALIAQENMKKEYRLAILSQSGLRERIITYLAMQARRRHARSFAIPFSREEMASFLCVNRSALSHELGRMQREGLISFRKNVFSLHSAELFFPGETWQPDAQ